jgi:hypothetical protein
VHTTSSKINIPYIEYFEIVKAITDTIVDVISAETVTTVVDNVEGVDGALETNEVTTLKWNNDSIIAKKKGRATSTEFEKLIILPAVADTHLTALPLINEKLSKLVLTGNVAATYTGYIMPEGETEASARSFADLWYKITLTNSDSEVVNLEVPVNVKYATGLTADNVCGWKAFEYALFGSVIHNSREGLEKRLQANELTTFASDYFILSFSHGTQGKAFNGYTLTSLLSVNPETITYNKSQSFPVQFNVSKAVQLPTTSLAAKTRFLKWLYAKEKAAAAKKQASIDKMLERISEF